MYSHCSSYHACSFLLLQPSLPYSDTSDSEEEDEMNLLKFFEEQKHSHNADEVVVTAAKEMGKELFANLDPAERKDKLDSTVSWGSGIEYFRGTWIKNMVN